MKHWYAIFGRLNEFLFDIYACDEREALALAKLESPYATHAMLVKPGGDLGADSPPSHTL